MNCTGIDWIIAIAFLALLTCSGWFCRRYIKGVADFLVAGRHMGKFLGLSTQSAEGIGLISIATLLEQGFTNGLSYVGIAILQQSVVPLVYGCTGFVIDRFRNQKVVTVPEYAEMRYSKGVRVLAAFVLGFAGIMNVAIFPIVSSQFLVHFLNAPSHIEIESVGLSLPFVPMLMKSTS